jgi:thioredoxin reductase
MKANVDYLIIGAGPAGLQLGYFLKKNQRDYLILERSDSPGGFFKIFPRHRFLISINKVHTGKDNPELNLRWDWNSLLSDSDELLFRNYSQDYFPHPDELVQYLGDFARHYDLNVQYNTKVVKASKKEGMFVVTDERGNNYGGKRLIVATGVTKPHMPDIPGLELCDQYGTHSIDPQEYTNKRVLIIGKGNSAFETANHLTGSAAVIHLCSPHSVKFAWQTHYVGNLRAVNNDFLDTYQLKSQNTVIDAEVKWIKREGDQYAVFIAYSHAKGQTRLLHYDKVIACTGFRFDPEIFDESCQPEMVYWDKLPAQTAEWESVNVPDMYFAGTLMQACDFKKTMSGFIHGFRYNIRALSNIFEQKYHGNLWPGQTIPATPQAVLDRILERLNNGSGIFLQPGFLCDVLVVSKEGDGVECYDDIRVDYVPVSEFSKSHHYYTVTMAYGHFDGDPFSIERDPDPEAANEASYLHPIIRRYDRRKLVSEHHVNDDLENEWYLEEYVEPLRGYLEAQLAAGEKMAMGAE